MKNLKITLWTITIFTLGVEAGLFIVPFATAKSVSNGFDTIYISHKLEPTPCNRSIKPGERIVYVRGSIPDSISFDNANIDYYHADPDSIVVTYRKPCE